ncbi:MAG TPA: peptidoglycan DD-metalloendopeptidase family protein [Anaerolineae bacterium]|nr:peptidoglycan DD-metalloendopeptidase family protein [Anaerolineae bacterium]
MNIIFVSNNMAKARTLSLWQAGLLLSTLLLTSSMLTAALILPQADKSHQGVNNMLPVRLINAVRENQQEHLNALALQLGQIQARVMRLDALSERLAALAGIKDKDIKAGQIPGQGGPMVQARNLSAQEISQQIALLTQQLEQRNDRLGVLEATLLQQNVKESMLPSGRPVDVGYNSSSFGWRVDPFTGKMAMHEGLDFMADAGTPIYAAAGGIVAQAETTPDYGNIVKLDHGSGLETRYAHASRLLVKVGERVSKGQLIAEVGNTGRSTGAHLHFEVRLNGMALDPRNYLQNKHG